MKLNKNLNKYNMNKSIKNITKQKKSKNNMYKNSMLKRMNRFDIKKMYKIEKIIYLIHCIFNFIVTSSSIKKTIYFLLREVIF